MPRGPEYYLSTFTSFRNLPGKLNYTQVGSSMESEPGAWSVTLVSGVLELWDPGASTSTLRKSVPRDLGAKSLAFFLVSGFLFREHTLSPCNWAPCKQNHRILKLWLELGATETSQPFFSDSCLGWAICFSYWFFFPISCLVLSPSLGNILSPHMPMRQWNKTWKYLPILASWCKIWLSLIC